MNNQIQLFTNELFGSVRSIVDSNKTLINNQFFKPAEMAGLNIPNRGLIIINKDE